MSERRIGFESFDGPEDQVITVNGKPVGQSGLHKREAHAISRWLETAYAELVPPGETADRSSAIRAELERIIGEMRNEGSRYKSHDLGFVDSVASYRVDTWADELEALSSSLSLSGGSTPQK